MSIDENNRNYLNVLVTGIGGGGHGEQILKALRMADTPFNVIGTDANAICANEDQVSTFYTVPKAGDPKYLETLMAICETHDIGTVFHGSEPELKVLSQNRDLFHQAGIYLPLNPPGVIDMCMDKNKLSQWLDLNGFNSPRSVDIKELNDISNIDFFPCVLKPATGSGGSAHVYICQTIAELSAIASMLLGIGIDIIAQEYVGDLESEFTVGVLHDEHGRYLNSIAVNRYITSSLGSRVRMVNNFESNGLGSHLGISSGISQGEIGRFPNVTNQCKEIAAKLGGTSAINIQCRLVNGKVYVFEINPRFSGTTSLRAICGYNEPEILIRSHFLNEEIHPDFGYKSGVILRSLNESFSEFKDAKQQVDG